MSIDTLEYVKTLESVGVERKVAEAHVRALGTHVLPELATRVDVERLEGKLEQKVETLEQKIETAVQRMEATVWKAAIATMGGVLAIGSLLIRFLR